MRSVVSSVAMVANNQFFELTVAFPSSGWPQAIDGVVH